MKKLIILMIMILGNIVLANNICLTKDFTKLTKNVIEVRKLKKDKNPIAQAKYKNKIIDIIKDIAHIKKDHYKELNKKQKKEITNISKEFKL